MIRVATLNLWTGSGDWAARRVRPDVIGCRDPLMEAECDVIAEPVEGVWAELEPV